MAISIPKAFRTVSKRGPSNRKVLIQNISFCLWNPMQPTLFTSTGKICREILSLSMNSYCANRQFYKFVSTKLFTLSLLAIHLSCWLFSQSSPQWLFWLCTSHQVLRGVSEEHNSFCSSASWSPQYFHDAHANTFMVNAPHWRVFVIFLVFLQGPSQMKRNTPLSFVKENVLPCTWSECTWSKIVLWNLVFIQGHRCGYVTI